MCQDPNHPFPWIQILTKLSCTIYFCCRLLRFYPSFTSDSNMFFTSSRFREKCQTSCQDPGTLDSGSEVCFAHFAIFIGFKSLHQRKTLSYKTLQHWQPGAILKSAIAHHVSSELTFKDKTIQGMEHVWLGDQSTSYAFYTVTNGALLHGLTREPLFHISVTAGWFVK